MRLIDEQGWRDDVENMLKITLAAMNEAPTSVRNGPMFFKAAASGIVECVIKVRLAEMTDALE